MTLRIMGADGLGALFDEVIDLAAEGWDLLAADPRFEVVVAPAAVHPGLPLRTPPPSPTRTSSTAPTCTPARRCSPPATAVVAGTKVDGRHYLKFTLLNPETTTDDIAAVLDLIAGHAEQYLARASL